MPKKKAKKKTVVSKARVRNATSSRTTNRTTNRVAVDYTLPPGPLSKVLDAHLASFKRMGEALTNRVQYSIPSVKDDARDIGIMIGDAGPALVEDMYDVQCRRLAHVVHVALVRHAEQVHA